MSIFKVQTSRAVGTTAIVIGGYTASTAATVIGLSVANITTGTIQVDVMLFDDTNSTYIVKGMDVVQGSSQVVVGGDQKLVLPVGYSVKVKSSLASSADVIMSLLEV